METAAIIGAGLIGQAIARRVSAGKHVVLADLRQENAEKAARVLSDAGFEVSTATVDISSRESVHEHRQTSKEICSQPLILGFHCHPSWWYRASSASSSH